MSEPTSKMPRIVGDFWQVAGDPDLGDLTSPTQEPVDFAVWQAADGSWQLWSCIRGTNHEGKGRLLYGWEGPAIDSPHWEPRGIAMQADPSLGETPGGLQAPHVIREDDHFLMFYGDWENICLATSEDGKTFRRRVLPGGRTGMFCEAPGANTRDAMVVPVDGVYYCYYTAFPGNRGAVYCRTSTDLVNWSQSTRVAFGGSAGDGPYSSECPFVVHHSSGDFTLFRTQRYGQEAQTSVYRSDSPLDFGVNDDRFLLGRLPVAAPEIVNHNGGWYIACLRPDLKGIQIAHLEW